MVTAEANNIQEPVIIQPGVGAAYDNGWKQLWQHFWELLLAGIIFVAISWGISTVTSLPFSFAYLDMLDTARYSTFDSPFELMVQMSAVYIIGILVLLFFSGHLTLGMVFLFLSAARGDRVELKDLFIGFKNYWNIVLGVLLYTIVFFGAYAVMLAIMFFTAFNDASLIGILIVLALSVLIIIIGCKVALAPFLLVDKKMNVIDAIKTSWRWTNGHALKVFLVGLISVPIGVAGLVCLIIGVIPAMMWIYCSFGSLYHAIRLENDPIQEPEPELLEEPAY